MVSVRKVRHAARVSLFAVVVSVVGAGIGHAQSLPSPWASRDIGAPAIAGSSSYNAGTFTVNAGGTDIWGTADQFHFVYQQVTGDIEVIARVNSISAAD